MSKLPIDEVTPWVGYRILNFFNRAKDVKDITGDGETNFGNANDPDNWEDYSIGETVAERILEKRNTLPARRFRELNQLEDINGLGLDKFNDLVQAFQTPSAEAFRNAMYNNGIIYKENWRLTHYTTFIKDTDEYRNITRNESNFRDFVMEKVEEIAKNKQADYVTARLVAKTLETAYIDTYFNSAQTSDYAFALWFYRFDADNWFSFDRVLEQTSAYFSHHSTPLWEMELRFFKGFGHEILSDGIVPDDLPVVTCEAEQSISIWTSALYD